MIKIKQLGLLSIIFVLMFQLTSQTIHAEENSDILVNENDHVVISLQADEVVELFEDIEANELIMEIPNGSSVKLIETNGDKSLISFSAKDENGENIVYTGYIYSSFLINASETSEIEENTTETISDNGNSDLTKVDKNTGSQSNQDESDVVVPAKEVESQAVSTNNEDNRLRGIALKQTTNVYTSKSKESDVLKAYNQGHILIFEKEDSEWYAATVIVNGKGSKGYIHNTDVDLIGESERMEGFALQQPTSIYETPSQSSNVLKTYNRNSKLIYRSFSSQWLMVTVYVGGKAVTGYLPASDVGNEPVKIVTINGIAVGKPTKIYSETSRTSKVLKSYGNGHILKYQSFDSEWYTATVYINGKAHTGYIDVKDVEDATSNPTNVKGVGLKNPTRIYASATTDSTVLKTYNQGHILQYRTFTKNWYAATVYVSGKARTGYIHVNDVETPTSSQESLKGVGIKNPTKIYSSASTDSKVLKSYNQGQVLQYRTFIKNWYEATVYINGKPTTGYIHVNDVESPTSSQKSLKGIGIKNPTKIYSSASTNSAVLKSYSQGQVLQYRTFIKNWYEATVYVDGKAKKGYIHVADVENIQTSQTTIKGFGIKSPTKVYAKSSTGSKVLKSYQNGSILQYQPFTSSWYEATVYVDGKATKGYIYTGDVEDHTNFKINPFEQEVINLTNKARVENGLEPLKIDIDLSILARAKSREMATQGYFSHISPKYGNPKEMAAAFGYSYSIGQNIGLGFLTPQTVFNEWMSSPGHKDNILKNYYTHIGIGYYGGAVPYWTQQLSIK